MYYVRYKDVCGKSSVLPHWRNEQLYVQPPTSAVNVMLPAYAADRRRMLHNTRSAPAVIDRYLLPADDQQQTRPPADIAVVDRWDRQTDRLLIVLWTMLHILRGQCQ